MFQTYFANWFASTVTVIAFGLMLFITSYSWKERGFHGRLIVSWIIFLLSVLCGFFCIHQAVESTRENLEHRLSNLAKIMAVSLEDAGHSTLTLETPPDDPGYVNIMNTMKRWMRQVPTIASIYTIRRDQKGLYYFVADPQSDLNRNGTIEEMERDLPIGASYDESFVDVTEFELALSGQSAFNRVPTEDDFGYWVTAAEPMYDKQGQVEAVCGVDFWGDVWTEREAASRFWPTLFYLAFLALFFFSQFYILVHYRIEKDQKQNAIVLRNHVELLVQANRKADAAVKAKDDFLANMSHEIRTPMNAILGMLHLVRQTSLSEKQTTYIDNAEQSTKLLLRVINDILDFSKIEAGKLDIENAVFSLQKLLAELEGLMAESAKKKGLAFKYHIDNEVPDWIIGDSVRLSQILINLVGNAIKFTQEGSVRIFVAKEEQNELFVKLRFEIRDTGIGMNREQLAGLFRPFTQGDASTTRKYGGTGLGLAISKRLVKIMHGQIGCQSSPGEGSFFHFTAQFNLPDKEQIELAIAERNAGTSENEATKAQRDANRKVNILLAEDNRINQLVAVELLTIEGYNVDVASNGQEVLEMLDSQNYDMILMDIQMPIMDGIEATKRVRENPKYAELPILAMTANAMSRDHEKSLAAGMNDHLTKPIDPIALRKAVLRWTADSSKD